MEKVTVLKPYRVKQSITWNQSAIPSHLDWITDKLGVTEQPKGSNRGPEIDNWERKFGMLGEPWCGIFASVASDSGKVKEPKVWSAKALDFIVKDFAIDLRQVQLGRYVPRQGDYVVFDYGAGNGHVDIVADYKESKDKWTLIGGNRNDAVRAVEMTTNQIRARGGIAVVQVKGFYRKIKAKKIPAMEGIASYYGTKFHGKTTANGEIFDMTDLTAAHKHLKFGTRVRVTNPANGKSVIVRINDRGPFVGDRIIDLSKAAADSIGISLGKVKLEILEK